MRQTGLICDIINNIAEEECGVEPVTNDDELVAPVQDAKNLEDATVEEAIAKERKAEEETVVENTAERQEDLPEILTGAQETGGPVLRRSDRIAAGVKLPERFVHTSFVDRSRWNEESAQKAIKAEVNQLFRELKALEPVKAEMIVAGACVLACHMFLVQKYFANGNPDKVKARLVSHGNKQDREKFPDRSSPMVAIHSVLMVLALFAGNMEEHTVCKIDVKGAFVQTPMKGETIYLKVGKDIAKHVVELCPEYADFVNKDGIMYAKMLKAMYGCVQASLLWYQLLVEVLSGIGFVVCEVDPCVMRLIVDGIVNIILIYVDDLLVFATREVLDLVLDILTKKFTWLTVERDRSEFSYLGMQLIWEPDCVIIDMRHYLHQILEGVEGLLRKSVPGGRDTFQIDSDAELLNNEKRENFHTVTAKLLYLAKRARSYCGRYEKIILSIGLSTRN
jgi:hypothetical protein